MNCDVGVWVFRGGPIPTCAPADEPCLNFVNTPPCNPKCANGRDYQQDKHKLSNSGPLYVPAYGFLVLGRSMNKSLNGGVPVAYAYASFFLANTSDEVILLNEKDKVIDSFTYSSSFSIPTGASLSVKTPGANKNLSSSWCTETSGWGGSLGDKGTPLTKTGCK